MLNIYFDIKPIQIGTTNKYKFSFSYQVLKPYLDPHIREEDQHMYLKQFT